MEQSKKTIEQLKKTMEKSMNIMDKSMKTMENSVKTMEQILKPVDKNDEQCEWEINFSYKMQQMRDFSCENQGREPGRPKHKNCENK